MVIQHGSCVNVSPVCNTVENSTGKDTSSNVKSSEQSVKLVLIFRRQDLGIDRPS